MRYGSVLALIAAVFLAVMPAGFADADDDHSYIEIKGIVTGIVQNEEVLLDAQIYLSGNEDFRTRTYEQGRFKIDCPYDSYTVTVTSNGFKNVVLEDVRGEDYLYISMEAVTGNSFFGLDTPHAYEVVGILMLLVILGVYGLMLLLKKMKKIRLKIEERSEDSDERGRHFLVQAVSLRVYRHDQRPEPVGLESPHGLRHPEILPLRAFADSQTFGQRHRRPSGRRQIHASGLLHSLSGLL